MMKTSPFLAPLIAGVALALVSVPAARAEGPVVFPEARVALLRDVRVPAKEAGVLSTLEVSEGSVTTDGQVISIIDVSMAERELAVARFQEMVADVQAKNDVNLRFAEKSSEVADADVARANQAVQAFEKSISRAEIDQLRLVAERSVLAREQAELELDAARLTSQLREQEVGIAAQHLENRHVRVPFAGTVVEVYRHVGEWVQPGDPIVRLIQTERMEVEVFVNGYKHGQELVGRPVVFASKIAPNETPAQWTGKVTFVSPIMHPVTGEVRVLAELVNSDGKMQSGMVGQLTVSDTVAGSSIVDSNGPRLTGAGSLKR
jgi:macrolide-specific efflux system membrane fusion protein